MSLIFYVFGALLVLSALGVVLLKNVFHSAIALVMALALVAGIFVMLGADFLGASQILVYVGGIMIIMLFVIMLSQQPVEALQRQVNEQWLLAMILSIAIGAGLAEGFKKYFAYHFKSPGLMPTSVSIGRLLLGEMIVPFEAVSLALLAALVGAVLFSQEQKDK